MNDEQYAWYLQHRKVLADTSADQIGRFERALLTASGGGVAASFYLLANHPELLSSRRCWLVVGAACFALSFFSILMSHLTSHKDAELEMRKFDTAYEKSEFGGVGSNSWGPVDSGLECHVTSLPVSGRWRVPDLFCDKLKGMSMSAYEQRGAPTRTPPARPSGGGSQGGGQTQQTQGGVGAPAKPK